MKRKRSEGTERRNLAHFVPSHWPGDCIHRQRAAYLNALEAGRDMFPPGEWRALHAQAVGTKGRCDRHSIRRLLDSLR